MIGWELDCPALDAIGEAANVGAQHSCRVRACREPVPHGDHCDEHDTPAVRAMARPHVYVYQGRRIVLESRPWNEVDDDREPQEPSNAPIQDHPWVNDVEPQAAVVVHCLARPCWSWCGRGDHDPGCIHHPVSVYATAPSVPCLACGRETFSCRHPGACCSERCSSFWRDVHTRALAPAETAARWMTTDEIESWEERAALLQDSGLRRDAADRQALVMVWRSRTPVTAPPVTPTTAPTKPTSATVGQLSFF